MKIYTRFGDQGDTQLLGGQVTDKQDIRVAVGGNLDELNALLGVVLSRRPGGLLQNALQRIQGELFVVGSQVASLPGGSRMALPSLSEQHTQILEDDIDRMQESLQPLTRFVLPGGSETAALMHLARAVCRRTERSFTELAALFPEAGLSNYSAYLNRLGDWCFVAARTFNHQEGVEEPVWIPEAGPESPE